MSEPDLSWLRDEGRAEGAYDYAIHASEIARMAQNLILMASIQGRKVERDEYLRRADALLAELVVRP